MDPSLPRPAPYRPASRVPEERARRRVCWGLHAIDLQAAEEPLHPPHPDDEQPRLGYGLVLPPERRQSAAVVHRESAEGEEPHLALWGVARQEAGPARGVSERTPGARGCGT